MADMTQEEVEQALAQLDPETRQALAGLGTVPGRIGMAGQRAAQGASLMATPGATGMQVGGTYVSSNPLEHLSVALQRALGGRIQKEALKAQGDALGELGRGRAAYAALANDPARARELSILGAVSGDPGLGAAGGVIGQRLGQEEARAFTTSEREAGQGFTASQALENALRKDEQTGAERAWQEGRDKTSQAAALERARVMAGAVDARRDKERDLETWIGEDFESTGAPRKIAPKVLGDAQTQIVDARRILSNVDRVNSLLEKNPNGVLLGDDAVKLSTLVEGIKLREKEIQGLGVLNGQDYEILSRIVANPTSMKEALKSGAGVRPLRTAFQALRDLTQNDVSQLAGSLGFRARAGSPFAPRGAGGTVNVRWKGKVKAIPAEKLQEALAAGAEEVQ